MFKKLALVTLVAVGMLATGSSFADNYNNSFNNNSGTINIYRNSGGGGGYGGYYTVPVYSVPVYTVPVYTVPVYTVPVYTTPVYTYPVYGGYYYGGTTIIYGGRRRW